METITQALDRVTAAVGAIKSTEELEVYIKDLPASLQSNGMLIGLFKKRKLFLEDVKRKLNRNNCSRCGEELGFDDDGYRKCWLCNF